MVCSIVIADQVYYVIAERRVLRRYDTYAIRVNRRLHQTSRTSDRVDSNLLFPFLGDRFMFYYVLKMQKLFTVKLEVKTFIN